MKIAALLIAGMTCIAGVANAQDAKGPERAAVSRLKGSEKAAVTVYEIADFQCPFCARFARETYPRIDADYVKTGKVRWIFINFPLPTHLNAWSASEAAMCVGGAGGQFWAMHDRLFGNQAEWVALSDPSAVFAKYAKEAGAPMPAYSACVDTDRMAALLVRDLLNVSGVGITGTPAFIINNDPVFTGFKPYEEWKDILENALKKAATPAK